MENKPLQSHAPSHDIGDIGIYEQKFTELRTTPNISNAAITGDLGVGKSSYIRTYEKNHGLKFVYLTAADMAKGDISRSNYEKVQKELERQLLVELISLCQKKDIPEAPTKKWKRRWLWFYPAFAALAVLCGLKYLARGYLPDVFKSNFLHEWKPAFPEDLNWLLFVIMIMFVVFTIFGGIRMIAKKYNLPKLGIKVEKSGVETGLEMERKEIVPESLDTNLHEILYIFEQLGRKQSGNPVFVIEDLDRYPADICIPILTKFKQINELLNERYAQSQNIPVYKKHYKFWYVIRQSVFQEKAARKLSENDPYKFFDAIVPIIPEMGLGNSFVKLKEMFEPFGIREDVLRVVSNYIYDYRKLKDVVNEYQIFFRTCEKRWGESSLKKYSDRAAYLFLFVLYKIYYPKQYEELRKTNEYGKPISEEWTKFSENNHDFTKLNTENIENEKTILRDVIRNNLPQYLVKLFMNFPLRDVDLVNADLSFMDLSGAIWRSADLTGADLIGADLSGADLRWATLSGARLLGADLSGADLFFADLREADLSEADLSGATLRYIKIEVDDLLKFNEPIQNGKLSELAKPQVFNEDKRQFVLYKSYHYNAAQNRFELEAEDGTIYEVEDTNGKATLIEIKDESTIKET